MRTLDQIVSELQDDDEAAVEEIPTRRTDRCPSLPHVREALLDPSRWTEVERKHVFEERCGWCARTLDLMRPQLWHPELLDLVRAGLKLEPKEREAYRTHLERDACLRCKTLAGWAARATFFRPLAAALREGAADAVQRVATALRGLMAPPPVLLPAAVQGFDSTARPPLFDQFSVGEDMTVTLEEADARLGLTLETRRPDLAGRALRWELLGPDGTAELSGRLPLGAPAHEGWISGTVDLGSIAELQERLGRDLVLVVYPE